MLWLNVQVKSSLVIFEWILTMLFSYLSRASNLVFLLHIFLPFAITLLKKTIVFRGFFAIEREVDYNRLS